MSYTTKEIFIPSPGLVPEHAGQWGQDDSYWREEWGTRRKHYIHDWHPHVVAEGMVKDEYQLKRAMKW